MNVKDVDSSNPKPSWRFATNVTKLQRSDVEEYITMNIQTHQTTEGTTKMVIRLRVRPEELFYRYSKTTAAESSQHTMVR